MIKSVMCIRRRQDLTHDQFVDHWRNAHAPLIGRLKSDLKIVRYVQSDANEEFISAVMREQRNGPEKFDGLGQAWFRSLDDLMAVAENPASRAALDALAEDERKFIDLAHSPMFVVEEQVIFDAT